MGTPNRRKALKAVSLFRAKRKGQPGPLSAVLALTQDLLLLLLLFDRQLLRPLLRLLPGPGLCLELCR